MNESIESIIAEMRERAEAMQTHGTTHGVRLAVLEFARRIEAAWKREREAIEREARSQGKDAVLVVVKKLDCIPREDSVGNAAAVREALEWLLGFGYSTTDGGFHMPDAKMARNKIEAALSAPARNCDMLKTGKEAKYRFLQIAELPEGNGDADMREWYRKLIAWLFEPAKKGERDA